MAQDEIQQGEPEQTKPVKRILISVIVQPIWVDLDAEDNGTQLVSQPVPVGARDFRRYTDSLLELADRAKRGQL